MKILSIAWKTFVEQLRDLRNLLLAVSLPAGFMVLFALPYVGGLPSYTVMVQDEDRPAVRPGGEPLRAGAELVDALEKARYPDGKPILIVKTATRAEAERALRASEIALLVAVPSDLSALVASGDPQAARRIGLEGDPGGASFMGARWAVDEQIELTVARLQGRAPPAHPELRPLGDVGRTEFDYVAPGVIIFAVLLLVAQTAMLVVAEIQSGTLQRYQITGAGAATLFSGISLAQMTVAAVQVPLMTAVALMMGFHAKGSIAMAIAICMVLSLSAVGLGLLVSCVVRTPAEASNVGAGLLLAVTFLSGAFFPVPELNFLHLFGREFGPWDIFAAKHAFGALRQVLVYGVPASGVRFELLATALLSALYLAIGVAVFRRTRMRAATL